MTVMAYRIITNNTVVRQRLAQKYSVDFVEGDAVQVFDSLEQCLQTGWKLLTVPLPPNVPLIRSPIRTLVLQSHGQSYDVPGLQCLAKARERTQTLDKPHRPEQRGDLEHIDFTFVQRALLELGLTT